MTTEDGETVREVHLKVDTRFAMILVTPKPDEIKDANFPRNLHNAAELFLRVDMVGAAETLRASTAAMLDIYSDNSDGKAGVQLGRACVCWSCGSAGLPKPDADGKRRGDSDTNSPPGACGSCGEAMQTNWLKVTQKGKKEEIPWIEQAAMTPEEKVQKDAAEKLGKRKEIEANVAAALKERSDA